MTIETLEITLSDGAKCPVRANPYDAGMDFYWPEWAGDIYLGPGQRTPQIDTGVAVNIPPGWALIAAPRSGLGTSGANLANTIGVIDCSYQQNILITLHNTGVNPVHWKAGDRVIQALLVPVATPALLVVDQFSTEGGRGGFGSTGQ